MFERFADTAHRAVVAAQVEARSRADSYIGPEHLLIAVLDAAGGGLDDLGVDSEAVRDAWKTLEEQALHRIGLAAGTDELLTTPEWRRKRHIPFNGSAKQVLEGSLRQAISLKERKIRAEHIALAIASLPRTERAARILDRAGVDPGELSRMVRRRLAG